MENSAIGSNFDFANIRVELHILALWTVEMVKILYFLMVFGDDDEGLFLGCGEPVAFSTGRVNPQLIGSVFQTGLDLGNDRGMESNWPI